MPLSSSPPSNIAFESDVVYGKGGQTDLHLNIAYPRDAAAARPAIVLIHGGGWWCGERGGLDDLCVQLAGRGFVAVTVQYRLAPAHRFPAQVEDVKCAVRFLRAHATQYHIDRERIATMGHSAGAHLVMMLAVTRPADGLEGSGGWADHSSAVQAAVAYFGPTDLAASYPDNPSMQEVLMKLLGIAPAQDPVAYRRASPIAYVHANQAPLLLLQGSADPIVLTSQAYLMTDAMTKAGAPGRTEILIGAGHGWGQPEEGRTLEQSIGFIRQSMGCDKKG